MKNLKQMIFKSSGKIDELRKTVSDQLGEMVISTEDFAKIINRSHHAVLKLIEEKMLGAFFCTGQEKSLTYIFIRESEVVRILKQNHSLLNPRINRAVGVLPSGKVTVMRIKDLKNIKSEGYFAHLFIAA